MRALLFVPVFLAACATEPMNPYRAADLCEQRARSAQGPTGQVQIGIGTGGRSGVGADISVTDDFIRGRDPLAVYESCVYRNTGEAPVRAAILR